MYITWTKKSHYFVFEIVSEIICLINSTGFRYPNFGIKISELIIMKVDLSELTNIEGVIESFIFKKGGELLIPRLPYSDERIEHMGREVALCSALLEKTKQEVNFFELIYEDRHVIVQIAHNFFTLVVCENTADTTLIKLRLNVIHEGVKADNDLQKTLRKSPGKENLLAEAKDESELQQLLNIMKINV